jgi:hypothetical protein
MHMVKYWVKNKINDMLMFKLLFWHMHILKRWSMLNSLDLILQEDKSLVSW